MTIDLVAISKANKRGAGSFEDLLSSKVKGNGPWQVVFKLGSKTYGPYEIDSKKTLLKEFESQYEQNSLEIEMWERIY